MHMVDRHIGNGWHKTLWKILTNPTFEVVAAILVMLFAAWVVVETQADLRHDRHKLPLLFGQK
jgi:ABC-type nickel/cobalt efflux system permease component RcnA